MTGGTDIDSLRKALAAAEAKAFTAEAKAFTAEAKATEAEARAANAAAMVSDAEAEIASLKLTIEKLRREMYGSRSEHKQRLLDQLELQLDELEASATEDELAAEKAAAETTEVKGFARRRPTRKPFPTHLPRERVVVPGPTSCACCGSAKLSKIGEDITETLEAVPRQWKVIQTVREKFTCRHCEKIGQPPAPFHATPRGWAGPNLLAMILFEKYGQHQPLNRQRDRYAREGVDLSRTQPHRQARLQRRQVVGHEAVRDRQRPGRRLAGRCHRERQGADQGLQVHSRLVGQAQQAPVHAHGGPGPDVDQSLI